MLSIRSSSLNNNSCTPNIVPCRIHHTGPTKVTKRYWEPRKDKDAVSVVHFRGRKLQGRTAKLPTNYQGMILKSTEETLPQNAPRLSNSGYDDDDEVDLESEELPEPIKILEKISTFDEFIVWGHDQTPASDDAFVKNVEEWISFSEAIHKNNNDAPDASNSHSELDNHNE